MLIGDRSTWGIAAMNAYRAYGDDQVLQHAILMWNFTLPYFVTEDEAAAGKHPKRNDSLQLAKTCNGGEHSTVYSFSVPVLNYTHSDYGRGCILCECYFFTSSRMNTHIFCAVAGRQ